MNFVALTSLVSDINAVLQKHGIVDVMLLKDIIVTDKTVIDDWNERLSGAITNHLWPSVSSASVYHYTSHEAAESILSTGVFRLTNIEKRLTDGEIITFCKTHDLRGYLENDENGVPFYRSLLMPQLFYASFTESSLSPEDEEYFWKNFAASDGVRLTLDIEATNPNFRKIVYEPKSGMPISLLIDLISTVRQKYQREFTLRGISRLCAFYLDGHHYSREKEYRALFKTWPEIDPKPVGTGPTSYVEIPLGQITGGYKFRITEVQASTRPNMPSGYTFTQRSS